MSKKINFERTLMSYSKLMIKKKIFYFLIYIIILTMPRHRSAAAVYNERLKNLAKARAAKRRGGTRKRVHHRKPRPHVRRAAVVGYGRRRHYKRRGGFLPAIPAAVLGAHSALQAIRPITNLEKLGDAIGISGPISRGLDRLGIVGKGIRGLASIGKNVLGYGKRRRRVRHSKNPPALVGMGKRRRHHRRY
jgi:hypothetical protein